MLEIDQTLFRVVRFCFSKIWFIDKISICVPDIYLCHDKGNRMPKLCWKIYVVTFSDITRHDIIENFLRGYMCCKDKYICCVNPTYKRHQTCWRGGSLFYSFPDRTRARSLYLVSSDYAQPITDQVTEVSCPVIDIAWTEQETQYWSCPMYNIVLPMFLFVIEFVTHVTQFKPLYYRNFRK